MVGVKVLTRPPTFLKGKEVVEQSQDLGCNERVGVGPWGLPPEMGSVPGLGKGLDHPLPRTPHSYIPDLVLLFRGGDG